MIVCLGIPLAFQTYNFVMSHMEYQYLGLYTHSPTLWTISSYASFYLLNNSFIPLDLVVLIDMAKIIYTLWLESDVSTLGLQVKNMSLHEDLSQIEYLFCDKTGTLTQNELRFRGMCLRGSHVVGSPRSEEIRGDELDMLTRLVCLCHDVTRVKTEKGNFLTGSSQDELNLLEMTEKEGLGWFIERDSDFFKIEVRGKQELWKNLKYYEFSSDTKMMSRVVQNEETGQILVLSKGADSSIIPKCLETND